MGLKNRRLARFPQLDRPFHLLKKLPGRPAAAPRRFGQRLAPPRFSGQRRSGASSRLRRKVPYQRIIILVLLPGFPRPDSGEPAEKTGGWPAFLTRMARTPFCGKSAERRFFGDSGRSASGLGRQGDRRSGSDGKHAAQHSGRISGVGRSQFRRQKSECQGKNKIK